ncbi:hypothetical protein D9758_017881 [Tetrapyrgos nigripes]|uniref:GTP cyclohydrolase N-terminal domain-containing protein n=1 Tax=Tetrapyrgos nigripes TaxID=182062 RepID=A0A8H5F1G1_9AGAR|nr:hypothetical protein D9758_017881 [Tetrapyrgos nigripes]
MEVAVSKATVEPVCYLPGLAERFGISEIILRRSLFKETGGMYPEIITQPNIKNLPSPNLESVTLSSVSSVLFIRRPRYSPNPRPIQQSDVFGSDNRYMAKDEKKKGVGVVVYFQKEGKALGDVTKYLEYNLRKRGEGSADRYFASTEIIVGVKDMRSQVLMPDVLHWLGSGVSGNCRISLPPDPSDIGPSLIFGFASNSTSSSSAFAKSTSPISLQNPAILLLLTETGAIYTGFGGILWVRNNP